MDNPILIVAICMGKSIFPESREKNSLQTRQPHLQDLSPLQDSYNIFWVVRFVALRPTSRAMVMAGRSVQLTTLFPGQACTSS